MTISYNNQCSTLGTPLNKVIHVYNTCNSNKNNTINNNVHQTEMQSNKMNNVKQ